MGLLSKLFCNNKETKKPKQQKVVKNGDWEIHFKEDGTPSWYLKKSKDWIDADSVWSSPSGKYFFCDGTNEAGDECIALTTPTEGLRKKKIDDCIDRAVVTDTGTAYALSETGILHILNPDSSSQRTLNNGEDDPEAMILTPMVAAVGYDDGESVTIKGVDLASGKSWKKVIKYEWPDDAEEVETEFFALEQTDNGIKVTVPNCETHYLTIEGKTK